MALTGHGYIGNCKFKYRQNKQGIQPSKMTKRKMTEEEMKKYNVKPRSVAPNATQYMATIEEIEACRMQICELVKSNKDKIPNYTEFLKFPIPKHALWYKDESKDKWSTIHPEIPTHYFVRTKQAIRMGFELDENLRIIQLSNMEGDFLDYLYDIRTLKFRPVDPRCHLDRLLNRTKKILHLIEESFLYNDEDFVKALKRLS